MADNSSPDSKAIGGPKEGKYYILPAVAPKVIVGVDGVGEPTVPVVVDGKNNVVSPLVFAPRNRARDIRSTPGVHFVDLFYIMG